MSDAPAPIGDNQPPVDYDALTERLNLDHVALINRRNDLVNAMERVPETIEDEATAKAASDFVKQLQAVIKQANAARVEEKEPYLEGGRRVDGFFRAIEKSVDEVKAKVLARMTVYQRAVEAEARRVRLEDERVAREAAEEARKAAAEAEAAMKEEADMDAALEAEAEAKRKAAEAETAKRAAEANAASLSRSRSSAGTVASLTTEWTFRDLDREKLDLEALRQHLPEKALEQAVRSFIKAGGRKLDGVDIYEDSKTVVR